MITETESESLYIITPENIVLSRGWAKNPGNTKFNLNVACINKLVELFEWGKSKKNKSYTVTVERVYNSIYNGIIWNDWSQKQILTLSKIKYQKQWRDY